MNNLKEKVALVTGGGRGIGRAICVELAKQGANIVTCFSGNEASANETVAICKGYGVEAVAIKTNVANSEEVEKLFEYIKENYGRIDILVNNAGITRDTLIIKMSEDDFDDVIDTNLKGTFLCTKQATKMMISQRSGKIVNISSIVGLGGNAGQANYSASKAGVIGFSKSVAKEVGKRGITVNVVAPGFIETDMTKKLSDNLIKQYEENITMKRLGKPEDVANAVAFLVSEQANYITGNVICVDGGMAM